MDISNISSADALLFMGLIALSWVIFYYTIKEAVKNGILAAKEELAIKVDERAGWTPAQKELQKKYERGDITTDFYKAEFERLK